MAVSTHIGKPILITAWFLLCCAGIMKLLDYSAQSGFSATMSSAWPSQTKVKAKPGVYNLVLLAHPKCPCSDASVDELDRILAIVDRANLHVSILMYKPPAGSPDWDDSRLFRKAKSIPDIDVSTDNGGDEAKRFGTRTSGQVLLFDPQSHLVFNGGITLGRGHSGDNAGKQAIIDWVAHGGGDRTAPVYGCNIIPEVSPDTQAVTGAENE